MNLGFDSLVYNVRHNAPNSGLKRNFSAEYICNMSTKLCDVIYRILVSINIINHITHFITSKPMSLETKVVLIFLSLTHLFEKQNQQANKDIESAPCLPFETISSRKYGEVLKKFVNLTFQTTNIFSSFTAFGLGNSTSCNNTDKFF